MTRLSRIGLVVAASAAASVICLSANAMAAPGSAPTNYRSTTVPAPTKASAATKAPAKAPATPAAKTVTHHYALAASAFAPDGLHNTAEDYFNNWDPTTLSNQDAGRCFDAGLSLPVGATLKSVTAYYTAGSSAMYFELNRQDLINHTTVDVVSFDTTASSTSTYMSTRMPVPSAVAAVNMTDYAYSVGVCPSGTTTFSGVIIAYTEPAS
jgi:hypothetical protein